MLIDAEFLQVVDIFVFDVVALVAIFVFVLIDLYRQLGMLRCWGYDSCFYWSVC